MLHLARKNIKKWSNKDKILIVMESFLRKGLNKMKIKTVTIIGANGNMGSNVSGIISSFGNAQVFLISRRIDDSKKAIDKICGSIRTDDIKKRLIAKTYDDLDYCVAQSDWVFESVAEDMGIKIDITRKIFDSVNEHTLVTTGTSGLSLTTIAETLTEDKRSRYFGTHFFNPPYHLSLCELISTDYTNQNLVQSFSTYLEEVLLRTVVFSVDRPAFLANRVGFQFINHAMLLADEFKEEGGIDYIDYLLQGITGRGMPPLVTANFVGLDIHKAIIDNLLLNTNDYENDSFESTEFLNELVSRNHLGVKTRKGLYKKEKINGQSVSTVYDLKNQSYRQINNYKYELVETMKLLISESNYIEAFNLLMNSTCKESKIIKMILVKHVVYSFFVSKEVSNNLNAIDSALATGFNWVTPTDLMCLMGGIEKIKEIYFDNEINSGKKISEDKFIEIFNLPLPTKSNYDYRKFVIA